MPRFTPLPARFSPLPSEIGKLHPESLLRVPLVRQLTTDTQVQLSARAIDSNWKYDRVSPIAATGFNPLTKRIFYASNSLLAAWLQKPKESARKYNAGDLLLPDLLLAVHDYLHIWGYLAVCELAPRIQFGTGKITRKSLENYAFCHLVTEAVATVGLDYWYLCTINFNDVCDLGTTQRGLAVSYHDHQLRELRRFRPNLDVQSKPFFAELATFYCTGVFKGFHPRDLKTSPLLWKWMRHELRYGLGQREYIRRWLAYLARDRLDLSMDELRAPLSVQEGWQTRLMNDVGELLWEKVKNNALHQFGPHLDQDRIWRSRSDRPLDFRFLNAAAYPSGVAELVGDSFDYYLWQTLGSYEKKTIDPRLLEFIPMLRDRRDPRLLSFLLNRYARISGDEYVERDLFILN